MAHNGICNRNEQNFGCNFSKDLSKGFIYYNINIWVDTDALCGCYRPQEDFHNAEAHGPGEIRSSGGEADAPCLAVRAGRVRTLMWGFQLQD